MYMRLRSAVLLINAISLQIVNIGLLKIVAWEVLRSERILALSSSSVLIDMSSQIFVFINCIGAGCVQECHELGAGKLSQKMLKLV